MFGSALIGVLRSHVGAAADRVATGDLPSGAERARMAAGVERRVAHRAGGRGRARRGGPRGSGCCWGRRGTPPSERHRRTARSIGP
ncbi:hypothetical protein ACU686_23110 [Yinghuangia aomiensis]